eukprot:2699293-Prymnesium_polylepis.1
MWPFGKKQSSADAPAPATPPPPPPQAPPPPPPPVHFGVPYAACCVAVDPVQGTVAVGAGVGEIKLFGGGGVEVLLPAGEKQRVVQLVFWTNGGRLLAVHAPGTLR